ncbi:MAG: O-methyltransferase [Wenzhouxiangella sp.]
MSGSDLPYHLRPHKAVDRRLFFDLLARYERWRPLSEYVYLSMGAYPLEDHKQVHRAFGITRLISFEADANVVQRQKFNRPISTCVCLCRKSEDVVDRIDDILNEANAQDATGVIIWLDYTNPRALGEQIREFRTLLDKLAPDDIVRVTVNANPSSLGHAFRSDGSQLSRNELHEKRFAVIEQRIKEYLPSDASADDMDGDRLPLLLARAFGRAALEALPTSGSSTFTPLSIVTYADGQQMLSLTGAIVARDRREELLGKVSIGSWPFGATDWTTVHRLNVPDLTIRERLFLEQKIASFDPRTIADELGFDFGRQVPLGDFIEDYQKYYRFYPSLLAADV